MKKTNTFKALKYTVCGAAMMLSLNACLPNDNAATDYASEAEFAQAQSQYYANAIQQYSVKSSFALTNLASWANQTVPQGKLDLTDVDFGSLDMGQSEVFIESAYCKTTAGDAVHLTWFDSEDEDGNFAIQGVGSGNSGYLMAALSEAVNFESLGTHDNGTVYMKDGVGETTIPAACGSLGIPEGAPVIVSSLSVPTPGTATDDMTRFEYRTIGCTAGETGSIQQQLQVTYTSGGSIVSNGAHYSLLSEIPDANWNTVSDTCRSVEEKDSFTVSVSTSDSGIDFASLAPAAGATADVLQSALSNTECRELARMANNGEDMQDVQNSKLFDTCSSQISVAALQSIQATSIELAEEEHVTQSCSDYLVGETCFTDSVDGDVGEACADAWSGDAVLKREIWTYQVSLEGEATGPGCATCTETETMTQWTGLSLECSRYEQLTIECETRLPEYADSTVFTDVATGGFVYDRSNNVSGWADAENLVPNNPDNPTWTGFSFDCSWNKNTTWDCSAYPELTQVQEGSADRLVEVVNIAGAVEAGDWVVSQVAQCSEGETWDCSSVPGSTQIRGGSASRLLEILNPAGDTNDSGWTTTQTAQCQKEREFTCPAGTVEQVGLQEQITEVLDASGATNVGAWNTVRNSRCSDTRETFGCEQRVEERTYTGTAPHEGSWSGWTTVSLVDNCNNNSGGGSGGGSDICIMAGARVAMADGTTKDIAKLEVGDVTITGRVLQTFARHYDEAKHTTLEGYLKMGEGLFNVDGIVGTGRHAFLGKDGWTELANAAEAQIERHDVAMLYNAVMENNIIPLVGDSGELYYYADEMNNIDGLCERAMARMMATAKIAA